MHPLVSGGSFILAEAMAVTEIQGVPAEVLEERVLAIVSALSEELGALPTRRVPGLDDSLDRTAPMWAECSR